MDRKGRCIRVNKSCFLKTEKITKRFGDLVAVDHVDLEINLGEIKGLIGENGSGKSTISQMISGIYTITSGKIILEGKEFHPTDPLDARNHKIAMIVQETGTIDNLTVAENIYLGDEKLFVKHGVLDTNLMNKKASEVLKLVGLEIDVCKPICNYNFETRKMVEIARSLAYDPKLFIVDETTTALSQDGRIKIHQIMQELKSQNKAVLFISHDLDELMATCDNLAVLRDGKLIKEIDKADFDESLIKNTMVGRVLEGNYYRSDYDSSCSDKVSISIKNVTTATLKKINLDLHEGEILGIGGLSGSGMHELAKLIFGMEKIVSGEVIANSTIPLTKKQKFANDLARLRKKELPYHEKEGSHKVTSIKTALEAKIGYISKDRDVETLILPASIKDNLCISNLDNLSILGLIFPWKEKQFAEEEIKQFRIKCTSQNQLVKELSGGNKQKVSFAKWIGNKSKILIFDSPTRGVDIGVKTTMYQLLYQLKLEGYSILIVSEELPELIGMSDRILIMKNGEITKEFKRDINLKENMIIDYMI